MKLKLLLFCCAFLLPSGLFAAELAHNDLLVTEASLVQTSSKRKLVVLPFRTTKNVYPFLAGDKSFVEVSQLFSRKCIAAMADTGRFEILDGDALDELLQEENLEVSADTPVVVQMEIGEILGVDYILVGTILEAHEEQIPYAIQVTGEQGLRYKASFVADYRVMSMATQEVMWSDSVIITLNNKTIQKMVKQVAQDQLYQVLFSQAATDIARNVMDEIYPLRVVRVQESGEVIVNHGKTLVSRGEQFHVFLEGDVVVDPETGETLGASDEWAATLKITRVADNVSYAIIIDGSLGEFNGKSICRRVEKKATRRRIPGRVSDVQPTIDGGVVLPFD